MPRTSDLPTAAYLVLGVLAANDEQLTAGEIKVRAELSVGYFYWSPSVSHVRRELDRCECAASAGARQFACGGATKIVSTPQGWSRHQFWAPC